jgi:hypothetical protein
MSEELRTTLHRLADETTPLPVDDGLWQRAQAARRRGRAFAVAAVLALVATVGGVATLLTTTDQEARTASSEVVTEGAIPSVIPQADDPVVTFRDIHRASVAYVDRVTRLPVLVDSATGRASFVELPGFPEPQVVDVTATFTTGPLLAVSPDGRRLAYPATTSADGPDGQPSIYTAFYRVVDLTTGDADTLLDVPLRTGTPNAIAWTADGDLVMDIPGIPTEVGVEPPVESLTIDPETGDSTSPTLTGMPAPSGRISATYPVDDEPVRDVPFATDDGDLDRPLPTDLYPEGAAVTPVGWADDSLLVAQVDAPDGSYVEGRHLVLLTSPDRPESEWTYRILVRDVPDAEGLSLAVDLIPDLDGTSSQQLTHDFAASAASGQRDISWLIGLGVAAAIAVLLGLRWLWRRLT